MSVTVAFIIDKISKTNMYLHSVTITLTLNNIGKIYQNCIIFNFIKS